MGDKIQTCSNWDFFYSGELFLPALQRERIVKKRTQNETLTIVWEIQCPRRVFVTNHFWSVRRPKCCLINSVNRRFIFNWDLTAFRSRAWSHRIRHWIRGILRYCIRRELQWYILRTDHFSIDVDDVLISENDNRLIGTDTDRCGPSFSSNCRLWIHIVNKYYFYEIRRFTFYENAQHYFDPHGPILEPSSLF